MTKRMIIVIIVLVIVFGGIFGFDAIRTKKIRQFEQNFRPPPTSVSTAKAKQQSWQPLLKAVGSLVAINGVNVSSEVKGIIVAINFKSGQMVKKGQSLVQLDDSADVQSFNAYEADLRLDKLDFTRKKTLYSKQAISESDYDQALAILQKAQAIVNQSLVAIAKKNIRAPFSGKIGIMPINIGQYINPGDTLVSLQQLDPLYINFPLPEQNLKNLHVGQKLSIIIEAYPTEKFYGTITAINAEVTQSTRSISVQGMVPNKDNRLYPGVFAEVSVYLPQQKNVVTVPQTAVSYSLYGNTIYVIKTDSKKTKGKLGLHVEQRYVTAGDMANNDVVISNGVKAGEEVVTSGQNKLQNKMAVVIDNSVKMPTPDPQTLRGP